MLVAGNRFDNLTTRVVPFVLAFTPIGIQTNSYVIPSDPLSPNITGRSVNDAVILPDQSFLLSVFNDTNSYVYKLFQNGTLDYSFGPTGFVTAATVAPSGRPNRVALSRGCLVQSVVVFESANVPFTASISIFNVTEGSANNAVLNGLDPFTVTTAAVLGKGNDTNYYVAGNVRHSESPMRGSGAIAAVNRDTGLTSASWTLVSDLDPSSNATYELGGIVTINSTRVAVAYRRYNATTNWVGVQFRDSETSSVVGFLQTSGVILLRTPMAIYLEREGCVALAAQVASVLWINCFTPDLKVQPSWNTTVNDGLIYTSTDFLLNNVWEVHQIVPAAGGGMYVFALIQASMSFRAGAIFKFNTTGRKDMAFGLDGMAQFVLPFVYNGFSTVTCGLLMPDDQRYLYVGGYFNADYGQSAFIGRILASTGALDSTFGSRGVTLIEDINPGSFSYLKRMFVDTTTNEIVGIGSSSQLNGLSRVMIARLDRFSGALNCVYRDRLSQDGVAEVVQLPESYIVATIESRALGVSAINSANLTRCGPVCGNGVLEEAEQCDDGNLIRGDGCSGCKIDAGFICRYPGFLCQSSS